MAQALHHPSRPHPSSCCLTYVRVRPQRCRHTRCCQQHCPPAAHIHTVPMPTCDTGQQDPCAAAPPKTACKHGRRTQPACWALCLRTATRVKLAGTTHGDMEEPRQHTHTHTHTHGCCVVQHTALPRPVCGVAPSTHATRQLGRGTGTLQLGRCSWDPHHTNADTQHPQQHGRGRHTHRADTTAVLHCPPRSRSPHSSPRHEHHTPQTPHISPMRCRPDPRIYAPTSSLAPRSRPALRSAPPVTPPRRSGDKSRNSRRQRRSCRACRGLHTQQAARQSRVGVCEERRAGLNRVAAHAARGSQQRRGKATQVQEAGEGRRASVQGPMVLKPLPLKKDTSGCR